MQSTYKHVLKAISLVVVLSTGAVATAHAQSIYPQNWQNESASCVNLTQNLSLGSRGSQVLQLQQFLVNENFPGGGTWMETSYYGAATVAAVKDFQQQEGLPQTGVADASTIAMISRVTCGTSYLPPVTTTTSASIPWNQYSQYNNNQYNNGSSYPYNNNSNVLVSLNLTGFSQNTGAPGTSVTIYGTGFDSWNNTVNFGGVTLSGIPSTNGTSLTFSIPFYQGTGSINVTVTDSLGTSNSIAFTVYSYSTCGSNYFYAYGQCGCNSVIPVASSYLNSYPYNYGNNCGSYQNTGGDTSAPTLSYLTPNSGAVGTTVTIFGSGFTQSGNSVHFGAGVIANIVSIDGYSLSFQVPSQLTGYGTQNVALGNYSLSVTNGNGHSTNTVTFTVTSLTNNGSTSNSGIPSISNLTPNSGYVGQQVTVTGVNLGSNDTIQFGNGSIQNVTVNGTQVTFAVPSYLTPYCASGYACAQYVQEVTPGSYNVSVMNQYGTSNQLSFQVL